jgi:hypothetical protein
MTRKTFRYPTSKPSVLGTIPHWRSLLKDRLRERDTPATVADFFELLGVAEADRCHGDGIRIGLEVQRLRWSHTSRMVEEGGQRRARRFYLPPRRRGNAAPRDAAASGARKAAEAAASVAAAISDAHKEWGAPRASDAEKQSQSQSRPRRELYTNAPTAPADAGPTDPTWITDDMSAHALGHLIPAITAYRRERGATLAKATRAFKIAIEFLEEAVC